MNHLRYLNVMLTLVAILLVLNLWTLWVGTPAGERLSMTEQAHAQANFPNAAEQRRQMVLELERMNAKLDGIDQIRRMLQDGSARVKVEAAPAER